MESEGEGPRREGAPRDGPRDGAREAILELAAGPVGSPPPQGRDRKERDVEESVETVVVEGNEM